MEDLAYRKMLDRYYLKELPLPNNVKQIARKIGMSEYTNEVQNILDDFFSLVDDEYHHEKADKNLTEYHAKAETARVNGKKGGRPKKTQSKPTPNPEETQLVNLANPEETGSKANHKPITNNQEQVKDTAQTSSESELDIAGYLPTNKKDESYAVLVSDVELWNDNYGFEVTDELKKIRVWLDANQSKRKTKGGMKRFIVNWLNRKQDNG